MRSWTRTRCNGAFGARSQLFSLFYCRNKACLTARIKQGIVRISDTYQCAPAICAKAFRCPKSPEIRRPHSTYQKVVQGKCPLHFHHFNGVVCSNTLFSNTSALTNSLLFRANSTRRILEHIVWSNTSGFQFWGPLARTNFLSVLCGPPTKLPPNPTFSQKKKGVAPKSSRNSH